MFKYFRELGLNPHSKDKYNQTCLYYTCREGKIDCSKYLIEECGLRVNEIDVYGQNPIYYAVREGRMEVVKLMIEKGSNINIEDKYGQNCIFYSVREGHYAMTELLIQKGANINQVDKKKMTPYSFAEKFNQWKIAELLLANGAKKPEHKNDREKKPKKSLVKPQASHEVKESRTEMTIEEIQKPKKYVLVKVDCDGRKSVLTEEEINQFKSQYGDVYCYIENKEDRKRLTESANKDLLYYDSWEKQAKKLMNSLWKVKDAELFHKPVDPIELGIPDYFDVIKNPMDFSTIKKKLSNGVYTNFKEFCDDINLTFTNCYTYNGETTPVGLMCTNVKNEYHKLYNLYSMQKFL